MKFLTALGIVVLVAALSMKPKSIEERVQVQLEESESLHDSAMVLLKELHDCNDSLLTQYFGEMKKILEAFKGAEGEVSSKRLVGIVGAFILFATFCANSFSHIETAPSDKLVEAVEWVVILCLGFTSIEKFKK
jgi:hypothetical protein